jgi:Family of unknown function (DUF6493)
MSQEQLAALLEKGDTKACLRFFAPLSEKERQAYASQVGTWFKSLSKNAFLETAPGTFQRNVLLEAAEVAVQACCSLGDLKHLGARALPLNELQFEIFTARRPVWLDAWTRWLCEAAPLRWPLVRRFVRQGLCRAPETDHYVLGMIVGVCAYHDNKNTLYSALQEDRELLEKDVWRLFEVEGEKEFCLASRDKYSRADNQWTYALVRLAQEKKLSRARLLDASLAALQLDFAQFHAGWFSQFHEALEPTVKERQERCASYLALLASKIPPTVSFALNALAILAAEDMLDSKALVEAIGPALWSRHKGTVRTALQLLDETARKHSELRPQIGMVTMEALRHESPDVQKDAMRLLEKYTSPITAELAEALSERLEHVAASQRPRLQKLIPANASTAEEAPVNSHAINQCDGILEKVLRKRAESLDKKWRALAGVDALLSGLEEGSDSIAALNLNPLAIPRLRRDRRINRIEDLDELIDVFAHVLEEPEDPMEVERVLDGVSRLSDQRPDDFAARTGPLRKRALDRLGKLFAGPFIGCGVLADLCGIARAWLKGEVVLPVKKGVRQFDKNLHNWQYDNSKRLVQFCVYQWPTPRAFFSRRALAVAQRCAAGNAAPLLAAPTHTGGWIDPRELVRRALVLDSLKQIADPVDQIQALLRLAPDNRAAAVKAARKLAGEFGAAVRYALGTKESIGADPSLWVAAARARGPFADDECLEKKHPGLGPDAGRAARHCASIQVRNKGKYRALVINVEPAPPAQLVAEQVTVLMNPRAGKEGEIYAMETSDTVADLRCALTMWPMQREGWFARVLPRFAQNLDWWEAVWPNRTLLEPLLDPDLPLQPMALMLLALGLAAKQPGESGLATDCLIAAIDDGRLNASRLGAALAFLAPLIKCARLARTLGQAARVSLLHLQAVAQVIQSTLRGDPQQAPRDVQALLELLRECLSELGASVGDAGARHYLERIETGGRTARLVQELVALKGQPQPLIRRQALLRALEHRVGRIESWADEVSSIGSCD